MSSEKKLNISILMIWLFNVAGIIGITSEYRDWFLAMTPLDLLLYFVLIIWNSDYKIPLLWTLLIPFCIGFFVEFLGVNYGWIFGDYHYGSSLGLQVYGVPLIIGVNWAILVYCTAAIVKKVTNTLVFGSGIAALLMVLLDLIMEVSAPKLDFWEFSNGIVPLQNYLGWLGTAFVAQLLFQRVFKMTQFKIALHIFIAMIVFFTFFYFFT